MTRNEALAVAESVKDVDGGCSTCVGNVVAELGFRLRGYDWPALLVEVGYREYRSATVPESQLYTSEEWTLLQLQRDIRDRCGRG